MNQTKFDQLVHRLSYDRKNRLKNFAKLKDNHKASVLLRLTKHIQHQIVNQLDEDTLVKILEQTDPDEATDLLQLLPTKNQKSLIGKLNQQLQNSIQILLQFDPETAAGVMQINYIQVELTDTMESVARQVQVHEKRTGKIPTILAVKESKLVGELPTHTLGFTKPDQLASQYVRKIASINYQVGHKKVVAHFRQHPHSKVVVVGDTKQVLGVIYTDDILKLIQRQEAASLYDFAGISSEESIYDSASRKIFFRYKWLIINLGTSFLAAFTVGLFDATISKHVLLAVYMPIVAGMGGNSATQTLAVMVRGLSQNKLSSATILNTLKNEVLSGLANGVINGIIVTVVVYLLNRNLMVGLVLGFAMIFNLFIASVFGTLVPVLMKKLGKDPASSATIFITTATDVLGFLAFLGTATLLLG